MGQSVFPPLPPSPENPTGAIGGNIDANYKKGIF
jgi:hypothetical protein